jgi:MIP family channel proteins
VSLHDRPAAAGGDRVRLEPARLRSRSARTEATASSQLTPGGLFMNTIPAHPRPPLAPVNSASARGLHGHPLAASLLPAATAEALGTLILVLTITVTAVAASLARPIAGAAYGSLAVPAAGGLALAALIVSLGPVSGAHLNPAVTLGLACNRRFPWARVPAYLAAQFAGAIAAAAVTWALYGTGARTKASLGASHPAAGVNVGRVLAAEAVVTFLLVLVITAVAADMRLPAGTAALAIGSALAAAILISGPVSGAGVNPARAIGPMILVGQFTDWWAYLTAPVAAGILAVLVCGRLLREQPGAPASPAPR